MANNQQITKLIRQIVQEEVQRVLPSLIVEAFSNMLSEAVSTAKPRKRALTEASYISSEDEFEPYPDIRKSPVRAAPDRSRLAALMGYGDMTPTGQDDGGMIVKTAHTENGTPIPVDPSEIPEHVVRALSRDYSDVMNAFKKKNG